MWPRPLDYLSLARFLRSADRERCQPVISRRSKCFVASNHQVFLQVQLPYFVGLAVGRFRRVQIDFSRWPPQATDKSGCSDSSDRAATYQEVRNGSFAELRNLLSCILNG